MDAAPPTHDPLSRPPWKTVPGIMNFRDIGGYPIRGSKGSVKKNLIFRSAAPTHVSAACRAILVNELHLRTIYDLRSMPEIERYKSQGHFRVEEIEGVERRFVPVFEDKDYSPEALAVRYKAYSSPNLAEAYRHVLKASPGSYKQIFAHLLETSDQALLIHCTAGKDRTGVIIALILALAGVEDRVVAKEYSLTEVGLASMRERIFQTLINQPPFDKGGAEEMEALGNMLGARVSTMLATLQMVRDEFGGVEGYLKDLCGFTAEEVERIRKNILDEQLPPSLSLEDISAEAPAV